MFCSHTKKKWIWTPTHCQRPTVCSLNHDNQKLVELCTLCKPKVSLHYTNDNGTNKYTNGGSESYYLQQIFYWIAAISYIWYR